jgi:hypothetical protein
MSNTPHRALTFNSGEANKIYAFIASQHITGQMNVKCTKLLIEQKQKLHELCFICLKTGHRLKDCKSDKKCVYCGKSKKTSQKLMFEEVSDKC